MSRHLRSSSASTTPSLSLVFYRSKPPTGSKTDWVMHESRPAEGWVLCRVFRKKGSASANAAAVESAAARPADQSDGEAEEEAEEDASSEAEGGRTFIDFFARAAAGGGRGRLAAPVVSSSCLTNASHEQHEREQETTSREGSGA